AKMAEGKFSEVSIITVERNASTSSIVDTKFLDEKENDLINLCNIKFFTVHYDYNVPDENGIVPADQYGEVCSSENGMNKCDNGVNVSGFVPKRKGYVFEYWYDAQGNKYKYNDSNYDNYVFSLSSDVVTLYAKWTLDTYTIKFNANTLSYTGSTESVQCNRNENCKLTKNGFIREGFEFAGWSTSETGSKPIYSDESLVNNLTNTKSITLYALWKSNHKVTIKLNTGGGTITSPTTYDGVKYYWKADSNGIISRSKTSSGKYSNSFFTVGYSQSKQLPNYNGTYINIRKTGIEASPESEWKCTEGECAGKVFSQRNVFYNSDKFCNAKDNDCEVTLTVNWATIYAPIFKASDDITSGEWHIRSYDLTITSENSDNAMIEYKVDDGNYKPYTGVIHPEEGIITYTARSKVDGNYSDEIEYVSMLDISPPSAPVIDNPTNGDWVNYDFSLTLHSTDNVSGIAYYQYKYESTDWKTYANSAVEDFVTTPFSLPRNELVYVRACNNAGKCSSSSSTMIRIDKIMPSASFVMLNNSETVGQSGNYAFNESQLLGWFNFTPTLKYMANDSDSGLATSATLFWNNLNVSTLDKTIVNEGISIEWNNGIITREISGNGYRYIYLHICDNAGNCIDKDVYFKFDSTKPTLPTITNPYENIWCNGDSDKCGNNKGFSLTYNTTENLSGISYWQYTYADNAVLTGTNSSARWVTYDNSSSASFVSTPYVAERNQYTYVRACDNAGNCSDKASTMIMIDRTKPDLSFNMYDGVTLLSQGSGSSKKYEVSDTAISSDPNTIWLSYFPNLKFSVLDILSGINTDSQVFSFNNALSSTFNTNMTDGKINNLTVDEETYYFDYGIISWGNRYVSFNICDNANNCVIKHVAFKINNVVNAEKYNCKVYNDADGENRYRLRIMNVTQCNGPICDFNKLNGLNNNFTMPYDVNYPITWSIDNSFLSDSLDSNCAFEYYIKDNASIKCYAGASTSSSVKTTISSNCSKISSYRTTMKETGSNGGDSWYYVPGKKCYIEGSKLLNVAPSACSNPNPNPSIDTKYHVTFDANGGKWANNTTRLYKEYYPTLQLSTITKPTRNGCTFTGWTYNGSTRTQYLDYGENGGVIKASWSCSSSCTGGFWKMNKNCYKNDCAKGKGYCSSCREWVGNNCIDDY
ncbi:MAG: InlB B-repeat-containing protein, partial [Bacilli bacterium]|nr:InlB B-repeat-containing protein [Bacilli bacterium]